ncbi:MAG: AAA family ATPase, partial [Clostridia bacterium]|nr:AAA family ATPase [Clostridia bacterium]
MLLSLHIENVAVIKSIDIDFSAGFSAITGETGAGKSVILDCIGLLLGAKAEKELIRHGFSTATVSGCFGPLSESVKEKLTDNGIELDEDGLLLVQRTLTEDGRSQVKLNGRTVTLALLRSVTPNLISIHGQSDTASLTDSENHIMLLDTYCASAALLAQYGEQFAALEEIRRQIREISEKEHERERLREILQYQINDIDSAALNAGEEEELVERKVKIRNSEKIQKHADFVYRALRGAEKVNVAALLDKCAASLKQLAAFMPDCEESAERLYDVAGTVDDIAERVYDIVDGLDKDPGEALNYIEERLD